MDAATARPTRPQTGELACGTKRCSSSLMLGLRPGELHKLTWDHVDLDEGIIHVWSSASRTGDVKTPQSRRSSSTRSARLPSAPGRRPIPRRRPGVLLRGRAHVQPLGAELAV
jgi:integrase